MFTVLKAKDGRNRLRKIIYEVAEAVLRRKVEKAAGKISKNALSMVEKRKGFYKKFSIISE